MTHGPGPRQIFAWALVLPGPALVYVYSACITPVTVSTHHVYMRIPRSSAQTTLKSICFEVPPRGPNYIFSNMISSNVVADPCSSYPDLANDCARIFRDPSRIVASTLLYRYTLLAFWVIGGNRIKASTNFETCQRPGFKGGRFCERILVFFSTCLYVFFDSWMSDPKRPPLEA